MKNSNPNDDTTSGYNNSPINSDIELEQSVEGGGQEGSPQNSSKESIQIQYIQEDPWDRTFTDGKCTKIMSTVQQEQKDRLLATCQLNNQILFLSGFKTLLNLFRAQYQKKYDPKNKGIFQYQKFKGYASQNQSVEFLNCIIKHKNTIQINEKETQRLVSSQLVSFGSIIPALNIPVQKIRNKYFTKELMFLINYNCQQLSQKEKQFIERSIKICQFQIFFVSKNEAILFDIKKDKNRKKIKKNSGRKIEKRMKEYTLSQVSTVIEDLEPIEPIHNIIFDQQNLKREQKDHIQQIFNKFTQKQLKRQTRLLFTDRKQGNEEKQVVQLNFSYKNQVLVLLKKFRQLNCLNLLQFNKTTYLNNDSQTDVAQNPSSIPRNIFDLPFEDILKKTNQLLKQGNIFALKPLWENNLYTHILNSLEEFDLYSHLELDYRLFRILLQHKFTNFKLQNQPVFQLVYPGITKLVSIFDTFFKSHRWLTYEQILYSIQRKCTKEINCNQSYPYETQLKKYLDLSDQTLTDKILKLFLEEKKIKKQKGPLFAYQIKLQLRRINLSQYIAQKKNMLPAQLQDLFAKIDLLTNQNSFSKIQENKQKYMQNIENQKLPQNKCLCCSRFFYQNVNIHDLTLNPTPLKVFKSVDPKYQQQIKDEMCSMLNSNGGVLLFGCQNSYMNVVIKGNHMTEKDKQNQEQRLMSYASVFQPKRQALQSVTIQFVPVFLNPFQHIHHIQPPKTQESHSYELKRLSRNNQSLFQQQHIKGNFIMRVKIHPKDPSQLFYWYQSANLRIEERYKGYKCSVRVNNKSKEITSKDISKQIRRKIKNFYQQSKLTQKQRFLLGKKVTYFNHECNRPYAGLLTDQNPTRKVQIYSSQPSDIQDQFPFATMLIVKQPNRDFKTVETYLQKQDKQQNTKLVVKKYTQPLKSLNGTAIIYHKSNFQTLQKKIQSIPARELKARLINITDFVQIKTNPLWGYQNPVSEQSFKNLVKWITQEYVDQNIAFYMFQTQMYEGPRKITQKQYFLQCQSHEATYYAFHVLKQLRYEVSFKNPHHLDKLNQQQKEQRLIKIFQHQGLLTQNVYLSQYISREDREQNMMKRGSLKNVEEDLTSDTTKQEESMLQKKQLF